LKIELFGSKKHHLQSPSPPSRHYYRLYILQKEQKQPSFHPKPTIFFEFQISPLEMAIFYGLIGFVFAQLKIIYRERKILSRL